VAGIFGRRRVLIAITALSLLAVAIVALFLEGPDRSEPFIDDRAIVVFFIALGLILAFAGYLGGFIANLISKKAGSREPEEGHYK
jgi:peptidoglycan/LPS O-acetylase OafA/YrhL